MGRFTAKDVAALAGVDPSTVSRVLRGSTPQHRYDPATVSRVREAAKQLAYIPSRAARALRSGQTKCIGLLVSDIGNPFFAELAARIERHARQQGFRLLVGNTDESPKQQEEYLRDLIEHGLDGLILSPSGQAGITQVQQAGLPLITVDRRAPEVCVSHVGLDDHLAGELLGKRLRQSGYSGVGVVMPSPQSDTGAEDRYAGLADALGTDRIAWVHKAALSVPRMQVARQCVKILRSARSRTDAIASLYNVGTLASLDAIADLGIDIPGKIGLGGIDDFAAADHLRPSITVISQPLDQIAKHAVELLLRQMKTPLSPTTTKLVKPHLIERQSLRALSQRRIK